MTTQQLRRYKLIIEGMTCNACAARLEHSLSKADGIVEAAVNLPLERAMVDGDATLSLESVVSVVRQTGFDVGVETRQFSVEGLNDAAGALQVEKALRALPGVVDANVNPATEQAQLRLMSLAVTDEDLSATVEAVGYRLVAVHDPKVSLEREQRKAAHDRRLIVGGAILTAPFLVQMLVMLSGGSAWHMHPLLEAALTTPLQFVLGARFYRGACNALRGGGANMDVLIALGTSAAYFYSWYLLITLGMDARGQMFFEASAFIITLVLLGKYLETRAKRGAAQAIRELLALRPSTALLRLPDGSLIERPAQEVKIGDIVVCRPGQQVAADGIVVSGEAEIDEALLTGESAAVLKKPGDTVRTGSISINGVIDIETQASGADSTLAKMIQLVENAQAGKPAVQRLVDRVSGVFVPFVVAIAVGTCLVWLTVGAGFEQAIISAVAVLVIACPCALGLATPTAILTGSGAAARSGILIKDIVSLEQAHSLSHVILDKTGTLTEGKPTLGKIKLLAGLGEDEALQLAASLQQGSEHPIAAAIRAAAEERKLTLLPVERFKSSVAQGVEGDINEVHYLLGNEGMFTHRGLDPPPRDLHHGGAQVWLGISLPGRETLLARFEIVDALRPQSAAAVRRLKQLGVVPMLVSGDAVPVAERLAERLGIANVHGGALPEDKARIVKEITDRGCHVGMVGDGINDAPALAQATVGIAMGSGTDVAMETAAITLMRPDPRLVASAIEVSRRTFRKIKQNLFWAFLYNVIGLPLAALGYLSPPLAAAAMAFSSLSVVANSLRLRNWEPRLEN